jgi:hypothetical protein
MSGRPIYRLSTARSSSAGIDAFDVALSFVGEQRAYVEEVANRLRLAGVRVFYDQFEEATLWGRDLTEGFEQIFRNARFVVMFISDAYRQQIWPTYERRTAVETAMARATAYILPVRFDDTRVQGLGRGSPTSTRERNQRRILPTLS